jgi:hypothetical protein
VRGLIPTGWYPTAIVPLGGQLLVTNAKGLGAGPNSGPGHPNPESSAPTSPDQYSGSMIAGTLSTIQQPRDARQLELWTQRVRQNNGFDEHGEAHGAQTNQVVPQHPGQPTPIKHVIYVVKENRTYDQEFGSLGTTPRARRPARRRRRPTWPTTTWRWAALWTPCPTPSTGRTRSSW